MVSYTLVIVERGVEPYNTHFDSSVHFYKHHTDQVFEFTWNHIPAKTTVIPMLQLRLHVLEYSRINWSLSHEDE